MSKAKNKAVDKVDAVKEKTVDAAEVVAETVVETETKVDAAEVVAETVVETETKVDVDAVLDATDEQDAEEVEPEQATEVTYADILPEAKINLTAYKLKVTQKAADAIANQTITEDLTEEDFAGIASFKHWTKNGHNFNLEVTE